MVRLKIDNIAVEAREGATVMEAARLAGVRIPGLCHHPALPAAGGCGVCAVSVAGRDRPTEACSEKVSEGMEVFTSTYEAQRARASAIELIMLSHPNECAVCLKSGSCELSKLYFEHSPCAGRDDLSRPGEPPVLLGPRLVHRPSRCTGCARCLRLDEKLTGGPRIRITRKNGRPSVETMPFKAMDSAYSLCAADLCPAGALESLTGASMPPEWMTGTSPALCTGCSSLCEALLAHDGRSPLRLVPDMDRMGAAPWMCDFGRTDFTAPLESPLLLDGLEYRTAGWDEAMERLAAFVKGRPAKGMAAVISARSSIEECLSFERIAREIAGASRILMSGSDPDPHFADGVLRSADRDANAGGAELIADGGMDSLEPGWGLVVLGGLGASDSMRAVESRPAWCLLMTSEPPGAQRWADVILPSATRFETDCTYMTADGRVRSSMAALPSRECAPAPWRSAGMIARAFGKDAGPWSDSEAAAMARELSSRGK